VSTISIPLADCTTLKQSLAALRTGHETYAQFVTELLTDLETLQEKLAQAEAQIDLQNQQLENVHSPLVGEMQQSTGNQSSVDLALQNKVVELESDRTALEEELENIRTRAVSMAEIIAEQKRQMSEDQSQWMAELRQLRRILDKQNKWITKQADLGTVPWAAADGAGHAGSQSAKMPPDMPALGGDDNATHPSEQIAQAIPAVQFPAVPRGGSANHADPVLGSVLSQFEVLQKDVARRRKQSGNDLAAKIVTQPEKMNNR
jgi:hypothetical protein